MFGSGPEPSNGRSKVGAKGLKLILSVVFTDMPGHSRAKVRKLTMQLYKKLL